VPDEYKPWILLGVSLATSLQTIVYSAKRNDLKRGNTSKRGFMHVEIIETDTPTSEL
jgi:hypothetical protein